MERKFGSAELALAVSAVNGLLKSNDYDVSTAGEVLAALTDPNLLNELQGVNLQQAQIGGDLVHYLAQRGMISQETASKTLEKFEQVADKARQTAVVLRKLPIEQVGQYAKAELSTYITQEGNDVELQTRFNSLSILEKAIYNLETLDGWVSEGTWLKEFLERRPVDIRLFHLGFFSFFSNAKFLILVKINDCGWYHTNSTTYSSLGILVNNNYYGDRAKLTSNDLEILWDRYNKHKFVTKLALLNRTKFAKKLISYLKNKYG